MMPPQTIFLLSPARLDGRRAQILFNPQADFPLAQRLQRRDPVTLGEVFAFLSGLYFRGKLTYAGHFAAPPPGLCGTLIITSNAGLLAADTPTSLEHLKALGSSPIDLREPRFREPLRRDALALCQALQQHPECRCVLLGSLATPKYLSVLTECLQQRLLFPSAFVGLGDMSRGSLMLQAAAAGQPLDYLCAGDNAS